MAEEKIDLHWLERGLDHDIESHEAGLERVRWSNRTVMLLLREIRGREQLCKELAAALISLMPGYEQYLQWARDRGAFGLPAAHANLHRAFDAAKLDPQIASPKAIERAGMFHEIRDTLRTIKQEADGNTPAHNLPNIARIVGDLLTRMQACAE